MYMEKVLINTVKILIQIIVIKFWNMYQLFNRWGYLWKLDYIKIDVDGIEHLILEGTNKYLSNKIKGISIEINDQFLLQKNKIFDILSQNNFKFISSNKSEDNPFTKNKSVKIIFLKNFLMKRNLLITF